MRKLLLTHIVPELNYSTSMAGINIGHKKWLKTMNEKEEARFFYCIWFPQSHRQKRTLLIFVFSHTQIEVSTVRPGDHPRLMVNDESLIFCADGPSKFPPPPVQNPLLKIKNPHIVNFFCSSFSAANGVVHAINFPIIPSNIQWKMNTPEIPHEISKVITFQQLRPIRFSSCFVAFTSNIIVPRAIPFQFISRHMYQFTFYMSAFETHWVLKSHICKMQLESF